MNTAPKPAQRQEPEPKPGIEVDDQLYVHANGQPCTGRVVCHGQHGVTVAINDQHHKITWDKVLGHKRRAAINGDIVDQGEDGMIVQDHRGRRRYIALPNEATEDPMVAKSLGPQRPVLLFMKAGMAPGPGLTQKRITDKNGVQTTRWVSTTMKSPPPQRGRHVGFVNGEHKGHGRVISSTGATGVQVKDQAGGVHRIKHEQVTHHWEGEGAPDHSPHQVPEPHKPEYQPRLEGENDKAYAKRAVDNTDAPQHLPEEHDRYFNTGGSTHVPLDRLHSTKSDEENQQGGNNGPKRMLAAYHGVLGKRDPIAVMPHKDKAGHYEVVDGNGTLTSAKRLGWKGLPTKVVSRDEGTRMKATEVAADLAKKAVDPKKYGSLPEKGRQPVATQKELYELAGEGLNQLREWLNKGKGIASQMGYQTMTKSPGDVTPEEWDKPGGMLFIAGLKAADGRAKEKVEGDYKGDWSKLLDVVRCTMATDTLEDVADAIRVLEEKGMQVMQQPKNKFAKPTDVGYRDMNFIVKLPNGIAAEVQFNVKDMLKAKNAGHHEYEVTRKIQEKYDGLGIGKEKDKDKWEPAERQAFDVAYGKQKEIYEAAWQEHLLKHYAGDKPEAPGAGSSNLIKSGRQVMIFRRVG